MRSFDISYIHVKWHNHFRYILWLHSNIISNLCPTENFVSFSSTTEHISQGDFKSCKQILDLSLIIYDLAEYVKWKYFPSFIMYNLIQHCYAHNNSSPTFCRKRLCVLSLMLWTSEVCSKLSNSVCINSS